MSLEAEIMKIVESAVDTSILDVKSVIASGARAMADDIERQGLPTTGPQALRLLAKMLEQVRT